MTNVQRIQERLKETGSPSAVMITSDPGRQFATGMHSSAGVALVTPRDAWFFIDFRYIEQARKTVQGMNVVMTSASESAEALIKSALAEFEIKTLGVEQDYMSYGSYLTQRKRLDIELVPASEMLMALRTVKQDWEIAYMRKAQDICEEVLAEVLNMLRPGVREIEISAEIIYRIIKKGADGISFDPIVVSGPNSAMPHGTPGEREFRAGDFITMDFGAKYHGYCSDMTRTVALGSATDEMRRVYDIVLRAQAAGIETIREGVLGRAVDAAGRGVIEAEGYGGYFGHGFGHCVGLEVHEGPRASSMETAPLPRGAVVTAEPGIYLPGSFGVRIEDMLLVEADGSRNLTHAPKELLIL